MVFCIVSRGFPELKGKSLKFMPCGKTYSLVPMLVLVELKMGKCWGFARCECYTRTMLSHLKSSILCFKKLLCTHCTYELILHFILISLAVHSVQKFGCTEYKLYNHTG